MKSSCVVRCLAKTNAAGLPRLGNAALLLQCQVWSEPSLAAAQHGSHPGALVWLSNNEKTDRQSFVKTSGQKVSEALTLRQLHPLSSAFGLGELSCHI